MTAVADDINANGLQNPIVVDNEGLLVAGRNRLQAHETAK